MASFDYVAKFVLYGKISAIHTLPDSTGNTEQDQLGHDQIRHEDV